MSDLEPGAALGPASEVLVPPGEWVVHARGRYRPIEVHDAVCAALDRLAAEDGRDYSGRSPMGAAASAARLALGDAGWWAS